MICLESFNTHGSLYHISAVEGRHSSNVTHTYTRWQRGAQMHTHMQPFMFVYTYMFTFAYMYFLMGQLRSTCVRALWTGKVRWMDRLCEGMFRGQPIELHSSRSSVLHCSMADCGLATADGPWNIIEVQWFWRISSISWAGCCGATVHRGATNAKANSSNDSGGCYAADDDGRWWMMGPPSC